MRPLRSFLAALLTTLALAAAADAAVVDAKVERVDADRLSLTWASPGPVDVYEADRPDADAPGARLLARGAKSGVLPVAHAGQARHYFILVDARDHRSVRVAERLVPLEQGSNFRDLGGYPAADGRHVRWGLIYRSAAQPLLTAQDLARVRGLNLVQLVDLRSSEERVLAPTTIDGVPYTAIGYPFAELTNSGDGTPIRNGAALYRRFPHLLAPQLKVIFADLLGRRTPIVYNCSAGQDRTGFATAMILSALGVPRETIYADYLLSTADRQPEFEMPKIDAAAHPNDAVAQLFAHYHDTPHRRAGPLLEADGRPFLTGAFAEIEANWGSVDTYLRQEIGLSGADIAALRHTYLE